MLKTRFSTDFRKDLTAIQEVSRRDHEEDGMIRYTMLIDATIRFLANEGMPSFAVNEHKNGYFSYHLKNLKKKVAYKGIGVKKPPHTILFKILDDRLYVARILQDSWQIDNHLDGIEYYE